MKLLSISLAAGLLLLVTSVSQAASLSSGNYRIPYASNTKVKVIRDHLTHVPPDRIDLVGTDDTNVFQVVAAADGVIRFIVDSNTVTCTRAGCAAFNNYVWIEHANGEWTKYTHMQRNSTTVKANLSVGNFVTAGTYLGDEDDVGAASGIHLHFEVAVPDDPADPIDPVGGFIKGQNRIPVICGIPGNIFVEGQTYIARSCQAPEFSYGVYRIPYVNGTRVKVTGDHLTHNPRTRIDMVGTGGRGPYRVAAAADGIIRAIVDTNSITGGSSNNNYVWIEHPNGEWTKYTHMQTGTVRAQPPNGAGLSIGQQVCAGTYLGDEDDVGAAQGKHLHFEVAVPTNLAKPFDHPGGFINGINRIPIICDIPGNIFVDGQSYTADPCSSGACAGAINLTSQIVYGEQAYLARNTIDSNNSSFRVDTYGSVTLRAGNKIRLRPGFRSVFDSYLHAAIRDCNEMPKLPICTIILPASAETSSELTVPASFSK